MNKRKIIFDFFRIVAKLHSMEVFRYCCPFQNSLQHELSLIIKVISKQKTTILFIHFFLFSRQAGTIEWFDRMVIEITKPSLRVRIFLKYTNRYIFHFNLVR